MAAGGGKDTSQDTTVEFPEISMEELSETMLQGAKRMGWTELTQVQAKAIPAMVERMDLMVQARTGSGKTGAFVLPILDRIDSSRNECQALILVPTRELANQVARDAEAMSGDSGVRVVPVYGGVGYGAQREGFNKGAHIVVGTPGRILDHLMHRHTSSWTGLTPWSSTRPTGCSPSVSTRT